MNPRHKEVKKDRRRKGKEAEGLKEKGRSRESEMRIENGYNIRVTFLSLMCPHLSTINYLIPRDAPRNHMYVSVSIWLSCSL